MFDQALGLFNDHFSDLDMAGGRFVKGRGNHLAFYAALHFSHFLRALVDQQHNQIAFRVLLGYRVGKVLQNHRLARFRRRNNQSALAFANGGHQINNAGCEVFTGSVAQFQHEARLGEQRG